MDIVVYIIIFIALALIVKAYNHKNYIRKLREKLIEHYGKKPKSSKHDFENLSYYWNSYKKRIPKDEVIDDITWNDLEMDKIFSRINNCCSYTGEQVLYSALHCLPKDKHYTESLEEKIKFFADNETERLGMQVLMTSLGKENASYFLSGFMSDLSAYEIGGIWKYRIMQALLVLFILLAVIFKGTFVLFSVVMFLINVIVYLKDKTRFETHLEALGNIAAIVGAGRKAANAKHFSYESKFKDLGDKVNSFKSLSNRIIGITSRKNAVLSGDTVSIFLDYIMGGTLLDFIIYDQILREIKSKENEFMELFKTIGTIDMAISIGSFRKSLPFYCTPLFAKNKELGMQDIYHPLIDEPVLNTITINNNCIITGSNASGKSTFIKAVAVNVILAQCINTCMAKKMVLPFSRVITSMAVTDDLMSGESYYIKEIKYLNRIIQSLSDERLVICVIDEILRGTNTEERIAASCSILTYIHDKNCIAIAATHDIELTQLLKDMYTNYHFREKMHDKDIIFDYKIYDGPSTTRNAIKLLKYIGFPDKIISDAESFRLSKANYS